jgi:hypothetical protein
VKHRGDPDVPLGEPDRGRQLSEVNLIDHALVRLSETGGMYIKALEIWNGRTPQERKPWAQFREVMVTQYEKMLAKGSGTTMSQKGWGLPTMPSEPMTMTPTP